MINLLPPKEKHKQKQAREIKLISILGVLLLSTVVVAVLSFLAIELYINNQLQVQESSIESSALKIKRLDLLDKKVSAVNNILTHFNNFYKDQFVVSEFLSKFEEFFLSGIILDSFVYEKQSNQIDIAGSAPDLEKAYDFRAEIKESQLFRSVTFSLADWMQTDRVNFKANIILAE